MVKLNKIYHNNVKLHRKRDKMVEIYYYLHYDKKEKRCRD
jgi:hypothetical protein